MKRSILFLTMVALLASPAIGENLKSFCEYGYGVSSNLGATGGFWEQTWGEPTWDWYNCEAQPNVGFLDENVTGTLETWAVGLPVLDGDYILYLPLNGILILTAYEDDGSGEISGQIVAEVRGEFVGDLNANRAYVDEGAGTVSIAFGGDLEPGLEVEVIEATGKFKSIHPDGFWTWHVSGTITSLLLPQLDLQDNILYALQNPDIILYAEEEVVLSGSYYRSSRKN